MLQKQTKYSKPRFGLFKHSVAICIIKNLLSFILIFFAISVFNNQLVAQDVNEDTEFWTGFELSKKINKKWQFGFEQQVRFDQNVSHFKSYLLDAGIRYKPLKWLKLNGRFRYTIKSTDDLKRIYGAATIYKRFKKVKLTPSIKLRYDYEVDGSRFTSNFLRPKIQLKYSRKRIKWEPYFAFETFYRLFDEEVVWTRFRYKVGTDYRVSKKYNISLAYTFQKERLDAPNQVSHIIQFNQSFAW